VSLLGPHQAENAALAVRLSELLPAPFAVDEEVLRAGLRSVRLAGRFDRRGRWLFDVAHNPDGVRALLSALQAVPPPRPLVAVVSVLRDKRWPEMLKLLAPAVDGLVLTRAPSAPPDRAWSLEDVAAWAGGAGLSARVEPDFGAALHGAARRAETVLVTGSFHTVGDAMARLPGIDPLA
jgi:dihydrofolate synthase/folylpolyglutamate synthase